MKLCKNILLTTTLLLNAHITILSGQSKGAGYYDRMHDSMVALNKLGLFTELMERELKLYPKHEELLRITAFANLQLGNASRGEELYRRALVVNPACSPCYLNLSKVKASQNDLNKAMELVNQAINLNNQLAGAYITRAQIKVASGQAYRAIADFNKGIELDPDNAAYYLARAEYNESAGYTALSIADLDKAIQLDTGNASPYYKKAEYYYNLQMLKEAMQNINHAIRLDSTNYEFYTARNLILMLAGEKQAALEDCDKAIKLAPTSYLPWYYRSSTRYSNEDMDGSCEDAIKCLQLMNENDKKGNVYKEMSASLADFCDTSYSGYYFQRGIAYFNRKLYREATRIYSTGLEKFPGNVFCLQFRANAYFMLGESNAAYSDYQASIADIAVIKEQVRKNERFKNASGDSVMLFVDGFVAASYQKMAQLKMAAGQHNEALKLINKSIAVLPDREAMGPEDFYLVRAQIQMALSNYPATEQDLNKCLQLNPGYAPALIYRALLKLSTSATDKRGTINFQISNPELLYHVNWQIPYKIKDKKPAQLASALADCNKALEIDSSMAYAYFIRGHVKYRMQLGDYCYDFLKAQNLGYNVDQEIIGDCSGK